MEFLISWLCDYVDIGDDGGPARDAAGRAVPGAAGVTREAADRVAERLTAAGFAVESRVERAMAAAGGPDFVLDVEVTSNRPDAMCHLGLARELATSFATPLLEPEIAAFEALPADGTEGAVRLDDPEGCPRYVARVIRDVRVGPSPDWLRSRLEAIGLRSINNVVDVTNYVLWELGQPLHAFDLAKIPGGEIRVRRARDGERLTTLDGVERELDSEMLVIADRERAIALAGIMGGLDTEVTTATREILLESAHFDRRRIRIGARRLGLHTDASHRFERGADFDVCDRASRRCAQLLAELAGGRVEAGAIDAVAVRPATVGWRLDAGSLERFAGCELDDGAIEGILAGLGFAPRTDGDRCWRGEVPSWRAVDFEPRRTGPDAGRQAYPQDLFEEILRQVGLDRIPSTLPTIGGVDSGSNPAHERATSTRRRLAGYGFAEAVHFAFHDRAWDTEMPTPAATGEPIALANPLSERYAVLRRSLVPNLVAAAEFNANHGAAGVRLFEVGKLFPGAGSDELEALALVAGGVAGAPWQRRSEADLFEVKGACEALLEELGGGGAGAQAAELPGVVPGTGAEWRGAAGEQLGWMGRMERAETPYALFAAELLLDRLPLGAARSAVEPPPRLPGIETDLTLTHSIALSWSALTAAIEELRRPPLVGYRLKDRYQGSGVPAGAVATTITFEYHGGDRTLTQNEVNQRQAAMAEELVRRFAVAREEADR